MALKEEFALKQVYAIHYASAGLWFITYPLWLTPEAREGSRWGMWRGGGGGGGLRGVREREGRGWSCGISHYQHLVSNWILIFCQPPWASSGGHCQNKYVQIDANIWNVYFNNNNKEKRWREKEKKKQEKEKEKKRDKSQETFTKGRKTSDTFLSFVDCLD